MAVPGITIPTYQQAPDANFTSLAQLPQVYQQAQALRQREMALATLAQNPGNTAALYASGDMGLANLAVQMDRNRVLDGRDSRDYQFRETEAQRAQRNADRSHGLQERTAERQDQILARQNMTPEETAADRAKAARANGVDPSSAAGRAYVLTGKLPEGDTTFSQVVAQRQHAAEANGLQKDNPGYQSFILTGKMPREDAQPLTAGDKEAIRSADDGVISNKAAIDSLKRATELSKKAFTGPAAGTRGYMASFLGENSELGKAGIATENLTNEVMTNALGQLKPIFGGNPTEGERKILLDLQGSANKPHAVRKEIFDRAMAAAQVRLEANQKRADELRGNTYYKPRDGKTTGPTGPTKEVTPGVVPYTDYFK